MVCDSHQAEDVTQGVFVALAQNARQLTHHPVLSGWLHRTTQNLAANAVRTNVRRQTREQEAAAMNELLSAGSDMSWEHIAPHLDAALGELSEPDRDAVLLRYFEKKSAQEMAERLGISDEAAQKRVSRAVERLREFFAKRGITVGASGLVVVISANAVQAAPVGLALTISAVTTLAGATLATTATATATKAIAMTTLQKTLIAAAFAAAVGTGIYEARQASTLRTRLQTLEKHQSPLAERIQQLTRERDEATRQLTALRDENERLNRNTAELLKLRGEMARLKNDTRPSQANPTDASMDASAKSWLNRVNQLRGFIEQNPGEGIPEFQFLLDWQWLSAVSNGGTESKDFVARSDYQAATERLRANAETQFAKQVQAALKRYSAANNERAPNDLSEIEQYCDPGVGDILLQLYEIKPKSTLPESAIKNLIIKADWFIIRKQRINSDSRDRFAIFPYNTFFWQPPP